MAPRPMNGHILKGTRICVDYWLCTSGQKYFYFLSHLHADHTHKLSSTFREHIYTSQFNAWLVKQWFNISADRVHALSLNEPHLLGDDSEYFSVTLVNANHCPGSVMFLFEGQFGCILYTGDFRYRPEMLRNPMLKSAIVNQKIQKLYLDNTFAAEHCRFPSRQEALEQVVDLVKSHPDHYVVIGVRNLGKEEVLRVVARELKEKVLVSDRRMQILEQLHYEKEFTTNPREARIQAKEMHLITAKYLSHLKEEKGSVLTILLSALHSVVHTSESKSKTKEDKVMGIHRVPYSDHSSHPELVEFVAAVRPHEILPIVCSTPNHSLRTRQHEFEPPQCSRIPESILKLRQPKKNTGTSLSESNLASGDANVERTEGESSEEFSTMTDNSSVEVPMVELCVDNILRSTMNATAADTEEGKMKKVCDAEQENINLTDSDKICDVLDMNTATSNGEREIPLSQNEEFKFISLSQENLTETQPSGLNDSSATDNSDSFSIYSEDTGINLGRGNNKHGKRKSDKLGVSDESKLKKLYTKVEMGDKLAVIEIQATHQTVKSLKKLPFPKQNFQTQKCIKSPNPQRGLTQNQQRSLTPNKHNGSVSNIQSDSTPDQQRSPTPNKHNGSVSNIQSDSTPDLQRSPTPNKHNGSVPSLQSNSTRNQQRSPTPNKHNLSVPNLQSDSTPNQQRSLTPNKHNGSVPNLQSHSTRNQQRSPTPNKHNGSVPNLQSDSTPNQQRSPTPNKHNGLVPNLQRDLTPNKKGCFTQNLQMSSDPNQVSRMRSHNQQKQFNPNLEIGPKPNKQNFLTLNRRNDTTQHFQNTSDPDWQRSTRLQNQQKKSEPYQVMGLTSNTQRDSTQNLQKSSGLSQQRGLGAPNQSSNSTPNTRRVSKLSQRRDLVPKQQTQKNQKGSTPNSQNLSTPRTGSESSYEPKSSSELNSDSSSASSFVPSPQRKEPEQRIACKRTDHGKNRYNNEGDSHSETVNDEVLVEERILSVPSRVDQENSCAENNESLDEEDDFTEVELAQNIEFYKNMLAERLGGRRLSDCALWMIANAEHIHREWNQAVDNLK